MKLLKSILLSVTLFYLTIFAYTASVGESNWDYDSTTNTLTLTNYVANVTYDYNNNTAQICSSGDLTIILNGTNVLAQPSDYGVYCDGDLVIKGNGSLTIKNSTNAIYAAKGINLQNTSIESIGDTNGLVANWGDLTANNTAITVNGSISARNAHNITFTGGSIITNTDSITGENITATNTTITAGINCTKLLSLNHTDIIANPGGIRKSINTDGIKMTGGSIVESGYITAASFDISNAEISSGTTGSFLSVRRSSSYNGDSKLTNSILNAPNAELRFNNYSYYDAYIIGSTVNVNNVYLAFESTSHGLRIGQGTVFSTNSISHGWDNLLEVCGGEFNCNGDLNLSDNIYSEDIKVSSGKLNIRGVLKDNTKYGDVIITGGETTISGGASVNNFQITGGSTVINGDVSASSFQATGGYVEIAGSTQAIKADSIIISLGIRAGNDQTSATIVEYYAGEKYVEIFRNDYEVRFDTGTDQIIPIQVLARKSLIEEPNIDTRSGYLFTGWYISATDKSKTNKWNFAKDQVSSDITLYAGWLLTDSKNTLKLPSSLTVIEANAFEGNNFEIVICPDSLITIEDYAFKDCKKLKVISVPDGVTTIHESIFTNCDELIGIICSYDSAAATYATEHELIIYPRE